MRRLAARRAAKAALSVRAPKGWATTDEEEIEKRVARARTEPMKVRNLDPAEEFFSTFAVVSGTSGAPYSVEIRSLVSRENSCSCPDFRVSRLGTCKHVEAVLHRLRTGRPKKFEETARRGSPKAEIFLRRAGSVETALILPRSVPDAVRELASRFFDSAGRLLGPPEDSVPAIARAIAALPAAAGPGVRLAREVVDWASALARAKARAEARAAFLADVEAGRRSMRVVGHPLYPYQEEGMLHLAFGERAMLVDDMGLGKTVQAIAACALLKELKGVSRVLVVTPTSVKTEWEEQIRKFTDLPLQLVLGPKSQRGAAYRRPAFFNLVNYEQVLKDVAEINSLLAPDIVILDEAQRIKNWSTKTAQAVKRLASPFAFVLTGTPLENRIDEIYSIVEFLDPTVFGPLFRFNREFYELDDRGRPAGYRNLEELRRRIRPLMLRRRKEDVEEDLPERIDNNYFVEMAPEQRAVYVDYEGRVAKLVAVAKRRPLTKEESDKLQKWLACMRMLCDTTYILDPGTKICPKLEELASVFDDLGLATNGRKALVFSEWERMLELVRDLAREMKLGFAWHTGSVPQARRRDEINRFKNDAGCKLFLSTDSGGVGLNLQAATVVINLDLPWNPAKLEQRIARAWRKHQAQAVSVVNLVTQDSIEHRMLGTLAVKRDLALGVVDGVGDLGSLKMPSGREAFLERLRLILGTGLAAPWEAEKRKERVEAEGRVEIQVPETPGPRERFRQGIASELSSRVQLVQSSPIPQGVGEAILVVVDDGAEQLRPVVERLHRGSGLEGKVEVLDRQTFEAIERLAALGLVTFPAGREAATELIRSPAFKRPGPSPQQIRRRKGEALLDQARRKAKVAEVLESGGFGCEALAAVREGVEIAMRVLAWMGRPAVEGAGADEPPDTVPASTIHAEIVGRGFLSAEDASIVSTLRDLTGSQQLTDEAADRLLSPGLEIIENAGAALARAALGGIRPA